VNASAPFTNDRYDEEAYAEADGVELSRVHISRTFTGDLEGESTAELMIAKSEGGGGYVGHDRITCTLGGRSGTFVFQHTGLMGPAGITNTGTIVPGTGSDELEGISGEGTMLADDAGNHTLTLAYELP
jgi:Protein of unknown function (DUF3224)